MKDIKLVIVTTVEEYKEVVLKLFKKADIESFSSADIAGHKLAGALLKINSWFPGEQSGAESVLMFSFTDSDKIEVLFDYLKSYNENLDSENLIRAIVVPIEKQL
ncbi:hypothetical protein [Mangrovimonas aestuarii]|uniref:hypothetical protein n=1 Tax=Mangrovimonas aestuarii TaxID=3018443 RepID=UPI0029E809BC|nr:hypothetical protein [Mangrovimonas aestuarii]